MRKGGGIVALIAGIFGFIAAIFTLFFGGLGHALNIDGGDDIVIKLGWGGVLFSFLSIILGAIQIGLNSRIPPVLLILSSLAGIVLGGSAVAVCLVLSLAGGVLGVFEKRDTKESAENSQAISGDSNDSKKERKSFWRIFGNVSAVFMLVVFLSLIVAGISKVTTPEHFHDLQPKDQVQFLDILNDMKHKYMSASNEMKKSEISTERENKITQFFEQRGSYSVQNWVGKIKRIDSSAYDNTGVVEIEIDNGVTVKTLSFMDAPVRQAIMAAVVPGLGVVDTSLAQNSAIFSEVADMAEGDVVEFSGTFLSGTVRHILEQGGIIQNDPIKTSAFGFMFESIHRYNGQEPRAPAPPSPSPVIAAPKSVLATNSQSESEPEEEADVAEVADAQNESSSASEQKPAIETHETVPEPKKDLHESPICTTEQGQPVPCHLMKIIAASDWNNILSAIMAATDLGIEKIKWNNAETDNHGMVSFVGENGIDGCKTYQITRDHTQEKQKESVTVMVCHDDQGVHVQ